MNPGEKGGVCSQHPMVLLLGDSAVKAGTLPQHHGRDQHWILGAPEGRDQFPILLSGVEHFTVFKALISFDLILASQQLGWNLTNPNEESRELYLHCN